MKKENIKKFKALINKKIKKINNIQNKKVHIKRNILYTKRNIISSLPFTPLSSISPTSKISSLPISSFLYPRPTLLSSIGPILKQFNTILQPAELGLLNKYIIFRIKNNILQDSTSSNLLTLKESSTSKIEKIPHTKSIGQKLGIKVKVKEKLYKEFEKEIKKIAKVYNLKVFFIYHPFKTTTKKGILIRMGKGKGKIIENYKFLEKNKIILILAIPKEYNFEKLYLLLQLLNKLNNKYLFLSKFEMIE